MVEGIRFRNTLALAAFFKKIANKINHSGEKGLIDFKLNFLLATDGQTYLLEDILNRPDEELAETNITFINRKNREFSALKIKQNQNNLAALNLIYNIKLANYLLTYLNSKKDPHFFRHELDECPITHEYIIFPATELDSGFHTFEYFDLLFWLKQKAHHPVTRKFLPLNKVVLNYALMDLYWINFKNYSFYQRPIYQNVNPAYIDIPSNQEMLERLEAMNNPCEMSQQTLTKLTSLTQQQCQVEDRINTQKIKKTWCKGLKNAANVGQHISGFLLISYLFVMVFLVLINPPLIFGIGLTVLLSYLMFKRLNNYLTAKVDTADNQIIALEINQGTIINSIEATKKHKEILLNLNGKTQSRMDEIKEQLVAENQYADDAEMANEKLCLNQDEGSLVTNNIIFNDEYSLSKAPQFALQNQADQISNDTVSLNSFGAFLATEAKRGNEAGDFDINGYQSEGNSSCISAI